jgi:hypothetical protein
MKQLEWLSLHLTVSMDLIFEPIYINNNACKSLTLRFFSKNLMSGGRNHKFGQSWWYWNIELLHM